VSNTFVWIIALIGTVTSVQYTLADTVTSESIRSTVYPYRTEVVRYQGITSGTTIGQQNWQVAEKALPAESARLVQAGDLGIVVQETTDGGYKVQSYRGGRPFPVIDPNEL
jgi:hypothetical protein